MKQVNCPSGIKAVVRGMTTDCIDKLTSSTGDTGLDYVLSKCIVSYGSVTNISNCLNDVPYGDKRHLLFYVRMATYRDKFLEFTHKYSYGNKQYNLPVHIEDLETVVKINHGFVFNGKPCFYDNIDEIPKFYDVIVPFPSEDGWIDKPVRLYTLRSAKLSGKPVYSDIVSLRTPQFQHTDEYGTRFMPLPVKDISGQTLKSLYKAIAETEIDATYSYSVFEYEKDSYVDIDVFNIPEFFLEV